MTDSQNSPETPPKSLPLPAIDAQTTEVQFRPASSLPWLLVIIAGVAAGGLFVSGRISRAPPATTPEEKQQWLQELAVHNAEFKQLVDQSRQSAQWDQTGRTLDAMSRTLDELKQGQQALEQEFERLATTEAGHGIAARPELVEQFQALRSHVRPTATVLENYAAEILRYRKVCNQALQDPTVLHPADQLIGIEIGEDSQALETRLTQLRSDAAALQALVQVAGDSPRGERSLKVAADDLETILSRRHAERLAAELQQVREESETRMRAVEVDAERKRLAAEEERRAAEAASQVAAAEAMAEASQRKLAAEQATRERIAQFETEFSRWKPFLAPMISNGRMQLDKSGAWFEDEQGPLSYAVLLPMCEGLNSQNNYVLMSAFHGVNCKNDRPL
ncbi:MAG: hypothetical protein JNG89_09600, partial [Planctomycetaceae bacterium]|nr:hypothetical protein [Planctomycetaceae bacterium]